MVSRQKYYAARRRRRQKRLAVVLLTLALVVAATICAVLLRESQAVALVAPTFSAIASLDRDSPGATSGGAGEAFVHHVGQRPDVFVAPRRPA